MQPESSAFFETASTENSTETQQTASQHGFHDNQRQLSLSSADKAGTESGRATEEQLGVDAALAASLRGNSDSRMGNDCGLNGRNSASPPARNRIEEYEKASTPHVKRREGPIFEVIKKPRNPGDKRSPVQDLPNEVLTHILALLSPTDLASVSIVSKRFHGLVTGPYAWRTAFAHFFPGPDAVDASMLDDEVDSQAVVRSERRAFTRLTALASWRSEYIMRTRLLRSLSRGKPVQAAAHSSRGNAITPTIYYNSQLFTTINHIHATFGNSQSNRTPRFVHGADDVGSATSSDPYTTKVDNWGLSDPQLFLQFSERFPGDAQYGLGPGEIVGAPNSMDVSQPHGMILGDGCPGGTAYFRSADEMRGRFLLHSSAMSVPEMGIPRIVPSAESITSVWIAKSAAVPGMTDGLVGLMTGSSLGVLNAYSLGATNNGNKNDHRFTRGELTARWVLSPGVPIVSIAVDNEYTPKRHAQNRIWVVALNALGEVFYLTKFPKRPHVDRGTRLDDEAAECNAWLAGRSVNWNTVEPSRRVAKLDPYADSAVDGSYSPRSSWHGMCLSKDQVKAETREIEAFATYKPKNFQRLCVGWDMRRKLEVDFAGDDGNNAGENVLVFECGHEEDGCSTITRYTRCRYQDSLAMDAASTPPFASDSTQNSAPASLFGSSSSPASASTHTFSFKKLEDSLSQDDFSGSITPRPLTEEWRTTKFSMGGLKQVQIMTTAMDNSTLATQTASEDPLLGFSGPSTASSPSFTPLSASGAPPGPADVPGQRARMFAAGTKLGSVMVWNVRAPIPRSAEITSTVDPVRIIHTDSPEISSLALSSLCLVHGGNDGLVQAWDVLASDLQPIRTLNSRFSSRARRRLVQAQASPQGVGINLFAAGAICLDPDSTVLRGIVSLGTHLLYWSYSSSAADQYKSSKRRLRRSERGSNNGGERFAGVVRSNLKHYIENEQYELTREKEQRQRDSQRFAGRFGTEILDGNEDEMIAYAAMLSQEAYEQDLRRASDTSTVHSTAVSSTGESAGYSHAQTPPGHQAVSSPKTEDELDADIAEAIRQSLATSPSAGYDIPIRHAKSKFKKVSSPKSSPRLSPMLAGSSQAAEIDDLDFAIQLSLAEEQSRQDSQPLTEGDDFPGLSFGKGKRRML